MNKPNKPTQRLTDLSEEDLIWIDGFAQALREQSGTYAQPDGGQLADELARRAFEQRELRALAPAQAAARWLQR
jgi:hypothetical protein